MPVHPSEPSTSADPRLAAADRLLDLLREEAAALRNFDGRRLLEVLPRKEALTRMLQQHLIAAAKAREPEEGGAARRALGERLQQVRQQNEHNRRFIENSLVYWRDLVSLLVPATYDRSGTEMVPTHLAALSGGRLNREV